MISNFIRELVAHQDYSDEHDCKEFSKELKHLAELEGERLPLLAVLYKDKKEYAHMGNYYEENGIWFIEPQRGTNEIMDFSDIDLIELEFPYQGFHIFTWDKKDGWSRAVVNGGNLKLFEKW